MKIQNKNKKQKRKYNDFSELVGNVFDEEEQVNKNRLYFILFQSPLAQWPLLSFEHQIHSCPLTHTHRILVIKNKTKIEMKNIFWGFIF